MKDGEREVVGESLRERDRERMRTIRKRGWPELQCKSKTGEESGQVRECKRERENE